MSDDFDTIEGGGGWLRGRDLIGKWCLFVVSNVSTRQGTYGEETVAEFDFADLSENGVLRRGVRISDTYIVEKLKAGKKIVGLISQAPPKQKGWQGAIYLEQPAGAPYETAKAAARTLLSESDDGKTHVVSQARDELEDLLA